MSYMRNFDLYAREASIADKRLCTKTRRAEDIAYCNERHAASILQSAACIATSLRQLGLEEAEFTRQYDKYLCGVSSLARETGYSVSALLHQWSEMIYQDCVLDGESLDEAWESF